MKILSVIYTVKLRKFELSAKTKAAKISTDISHTKYYGVRIDKRIQTICNEYFTSQRPFNVTPNRSEIKSDFHTVSNIHLPIDMYTILLCECVFCLAVRLQRPHYYFMNYLKLIWERFEVLCKTANGDGTELKHSEIFVYTTLETLAI